jgi:hypothetical protein
MICPFCIATAAVIAGSATGTGGVTALVAGVFLKRNKRKLLLPRDEAKEVNHVDDSSNTTSDSENGVAR